MRKGEQTRNFCISQFQGWLCYVKFITDCISVHRVNWRPLSQIHIYTTSLIYLPPSSFHQLRHTHGQMLLLWGFFTDLTLAFAQHSSSSEISGLPIILLLREYWMLHRGPGILAIVWFGSSPSLPPPFPSVSSTSDTQEDWERETTLLTSDGGKGGGGVGQGAESYKQQENLFLYESFNTLCFCWTRIQDVSLVRKLLMTSRMMKPNICTWCIQNQIEKSK